MTVETDPRQAVQPGDAPVTDGSRGGNLAAALVTFGLGVAVAITSVGYGFGSPARPGAGVFPFAIGVLMAGLALAWAALTVARRMDLGEAPTRPDRRGAFHIGITMLAAAAFVGLVDLLGYQLTMSAVVALLLATVARVRWWLVVVIALAMGVGTYALFVNGLGVALPASDIPVLQRLGL